MTQSSLYVYCPFDGKLLSLKESPAQGLPYCKECGFVNYQNPRPCVGILIVELFPDVTQSRVLLAQRAIEPKLGMWDLPGGFIDPGESAEEAVIREAREETSLHVRVTEYLGSAPDVYGDGGIPTLNLCFLAEKVSGTLRPKSDVAALEPVSFDDLPEQMAFAHQRQMLQWGRDTILKRKVSSDHVERPTKF